MQNNNDIIIKKFPYSYVKTFKKLPQSSTRRGVMVNVELRKKIKNLKIPRKVLPKNFDYLIFLGYSGLSSFGINKKSSNVNLIGSFINPIQYYVGLGNDDAILHRFRIENKWNIVCYDLKRLFEILSKGNVDYFPSLFLSKDNIIYESQEWKRLKANIDIFKSLMFPMRVNIIVNELINHNLLGTKELLYTATLVNMGIEYIKTGNITVDRYKVDVKIFNKIKENKYNIEIKEVINKSLNDLKALINKSKLRHFPDGEKINRLLTSIILNFNKERE